MTVPRRILGAVVAGGRSRRFGSDKALATFAGRAMIDHVVAALRPCVDAMVICGRAHGGVPSLSDRPIPGLGPLGGFSAALHHARAHGFAAVLTLPCDTPSMPAETLRLLRAAAGPAYIADCPVIGIWPTTVGEALDRFLAIDPRRSVRAWAEEIGARELLISAPANINRPADLALLGG